MTRHKLFNYNPKYVRDTLNKAIEQAEQLHHCESNLILVLTEIDKHRLFTRYGFKTLRGFCTKGLGFTKIQAQRIVLQIRRSQTTVDIGHKTTTHNYSALDPQN